jgi:LacI family transcriptional regulator
VIKQEALKRVRLEDVARDVGVSMMTVSHVINGRKRFTPEVENRVREAVARLGYKANEAARRLAGQQSKVIGLIVPNLLDFFFEHCAHAVQETARLHGFVVLVMAHNRKIDEEKEAVSLMVQRRVAGLLVVPTCDEYKHFAEAEQRGIPVVAFDRPVASLKTDSVLIDNAGAASEAIRHLIEVHGHRRIAFLGSETKAFTMKARLQGYLATMQEAKLKPLIIADEGTLTDEEIFTLLCKALRGRTRPTALFAVSNRSTLGALRAAESLQLAIPRDIALIGFDGFDFAPMLQPPLTAVHQPADELGANAFRLLLQRIQEQRSIPVTTILPTELVIRQSCGCNPASAPNQNNEHKILAAKSHNLRDHK